MEAVFLQMMDVMATMHSQEERTGPHEEDEGGYKIIGELAVAWHGGWDGVLGDGGEVAVSCRILPYSSVKASPKWGGVHKSRSSELDLSAGC